MKFIIITLFPDMLNGTLNTSMLWKAQGKSLVQFEIMDLREYGIGPRRQVDDTPYGGGDGMLLKPEPIYAAIEKAKADNPDAEVILPTPHGRLWTQQVTQEFADNDKTYIILCPHYEGYDARILPIVDHQIRLGNFIMTGGEIPALAIIDSVTRLIPGVLGGEHSAEIESFSHGDNLEYPQYTRPEDFRGMRVPEVLLSGHHAKIAKWREQNSSTAS